MMEATGTVDVTIMVTRDGDSPISEIKENSHGSTVPTPEHGKWLITIVSSMYSRAQTKDLTSTGLLEPE